MIPYNITEPNGPDITAPHTIDWAVRRGRALVPFNLDNEGLPLNPIEPTLRPGRGGLWHWGEAVAADAVALTTDARGRRMVLMVERNDGHGWAVPGGCVDVGETALAAVVRELREETSLTVSPRQCAALSPRYVPDPRAGRHAWMVTIPHLIALDAPQPVKGRDDAKCAEWLPADTYEQLVADIKRRGSTVFTAHAELLQELLT